MLRDGCKRNFGSSQATQLIGFWFKKKMMRFNWKLIAADQLGGAACLVSLFLSRVCLVIDVDDRPIESNDPLLSLSLSPSGGGGDGGSGQLLPLSLPLVLVK